ncbi:calcium-dependent protein kinase 4-like [Hordeum vulgare subsp. vulgare]|uniref:calcium-dependent protein kinase 4-like n=1 Tax=Hordeum vulgare subsp. vulgare TaxID=112509 RepID=UPI001D1A464A|nr:calcium-dependent protein kinase 4-like [Hordeum vulgare subsp. vulgare]
MGPSTSKKGPDGVGIPPSTLIKTLEVIVQDLGIEAEKLSMEQLMAAPAKKPNDVSDGKKERSKPHPAARTLKICRRRRAATAALALGAGAGAHAVATSEDPARTLKICRHLPPRLLRDSVAAATIAFDYHYSLWGLQPDSPAWLSAKRDAHLRAANRLQDLCFLNGDIYIKLGQHIVQLEYVQTMRESMLKRCPVSSYEDVQGVFKKEIGELPKTIGPDFGKKNNRYSEKDDAVVVRQMLKVAAECHLCGLVHRDMKPENFLFKSTKEDSRVKATNFCLSDFIKPGKKFRDIVGSAYYVAPEVLKQRSGPESDVWSIGVINYILLCGRHPFWDKTEDGIFKEVLRNKPDFRKRPWPSTTSSAKDFVKKLLVKNPRARLTVAQALSHPWVREGGDASEIPVDISVLYNMRQFVKYSRFKQFALRALTSTVNEEELVDLKDQFDAIDVDKSGSISIEEMRHALAKDLPWRLKGPRVLEIIQAVSFGKSTTDGLVDFKEFVVATLHIHQMAELDSERWGLRCQAAFSKFDLDGDGYITPDGCYGTICFNSKWRNWIHEFLTSRSSSIILNGVRGKQFQCKTDVKQGDSISPLLFILAADLLH